MPAATPWRLWYRHNRRLTRSCPAVLFEEPRHGGVFGGIAVLHPLLRFVPGSGAQVGADVRLGAQHLRVVKELVSAEAIALHRAPGHLQARRPAVARPYAVGPVVVRRKIPAGPPQQRDVQLADGVQHVAPVAVGIGQRRPLLEDPAIDAASEVLDEIAPEQGIDIADHTLGIDLDARGPCRLLGAQKKRRSRQRLRESTSGELHISI